MATQEELEQSKIRIRELEEQVKQLTNENTVLKAEKKLVVVENIGLREKLEEHDVVSRTQMQQVSSLTNLAIQVSSSEVIIFFFIFMNEFVLIKHLLTCIMHCFFSCLNYYIRTENGLNIK